MATKTIDDVLTLRPYWCDRSKLWVFDDPTTGLRHEEFVMGTSEMISVLLQEKGMLPKAKAGFRLKFGPHPFSGWQRRLQWSQESQGGNWYLDPRTGMAGWLCPALFLYFKVAPNALYVQVAPLEEDEAALVERGEGSCEYRGHSGPVAAPCNACA